MRRLVAAALVALVALVLSGAAPAAATPGPAAAPEYWFDEWHVPQVWADGARGQGVTIAEIDTGVNGSLTELRANVLPGKDFGVSGGDGRVDRSVSRFGHGTAMASIMVARPGLLGIEGLAPDAKLLPVAIPLGGTTEAADGDHLAEAISWAADHGAKVISMSLGGSREAGQNEHSCPEDEQAAIFHALARGAILFAAAGNKGVDPGDAEEPGVCIGVVSVGALNRDGSVATFSSRHPYLTMSAPGVNIPSLGRIPGAAFAADGTSQATALASAAAAVVWSKYPRLSGRQVVTRLLQTLDDRRSARDPSYGFGRLDLGRAVSAQVDVDAANPVFDVAQAYVARQRAVSASAHPAPPPLALGDPPGRYAVGSVPGRDRTQFWAGVGIGGAGVLALLALIVTAGTRRRRPAEPEPDWSSFAPPPPSSG